MTVICNHERFRDPCLSGEGGSKSVYRVRDALTGKYRALACFRSPVLSEEEREVYSPEEREGRIKEQISCMEEVQKREETILKILRGCKNIVQLQEVVFFENQMSFLLEFFPNIPLIKLQSVL